MKLYRKIIIFGAAILLLTLSIAPSLSVKVSQLKIEDFFNNSINSNSDFVLRKEIVVPNDYTTIQEAINAADDGDSIKVLAGDYNENVVVNKKLDIYGEGYRRTTIQGTGSDDTIKIQYFGVSISCFTIKNSCAECSGILIESSSGDCTIKSNYITANGYGIYLDSTDENHIENNIIIYNLKSGMMLYDSHDNTFLTNNVSNNGDDGMVVDFSSTGNKLSGNIASNNVNGALINDASKSNEFIGNNVYKNEVGIRGGGASDSNLFYYNAFQNNDLNAIDSSDDIWNGESKGNHWDDYEGEDLNGDGIGDTPYIIPGGGNKDFLPLIKLPLPGIPIIEGDTNLNANEIGNFHIYTPSEYQIYEEVYYEIDWDDSAHRETTSNPVNTTQGVDETHSWSFSKGVEKRVYYVVARACIEYEGERITSFDSEALPVTVIQKSRSLNYDIILDILKKKTYFSNNKVDAFNRDCDYVVPRDFTTIQDAIDNVDDGSTICVWDGIYKENIKIKNKSLKILGNSSETCIIEGDNTENSVVTIEYTDNVTFSGFQITGGNNAGIWLDYANDCVISDNTYAEDGKNSLLVYYSLNTTIINNKFYLCGLGIFGDTTDHFIQTVEEVYVNDLPLFYAKNQKVNLWGQTDSYGSIILVNCTGRIDEFKTLGNTYLGIEIAYCSDIEVKNSNSIHSNRYGIYVYNCKEDVELYANHIENNDLYGVYIRKSTVEFYDNIVQDNYYGLCIWDSTNNQLVRNTFTDNSQSGIYLHYSHYNEIGEENLINKNVNGIDVISSNFNIIHNNTIEKNSYDGIFLKNASNNTIIWNIIEHNALKGTENEVKNGIEVKQYSNGNLIEYNTIGFQKFYGILIYEQSNQNRIIHNNFFYNGFFWNFKDSHASDSCSNIWDNGYPEDFEDFRYVHGITRECGNCYSNFLSFDLNHGPNQNIPGNDNVSDAPYEIPGGNNVERYPIMRFFPEDTAEPELHPVYPNQGFLHIYPFINYDWPLKSTFVVFLKIGKNTSLLKLKFKANAFEPYDESFQSNLVRVNFSLTHYRTEETLTSGWINYDPFGTGYEWDLTSVRLFGKYRLEVVAMDSAGNDNTLEYDPIYIFNLARNS